MTCCSRCSTRGPLTSSTTTTARKPARSPTTGPTGTWPTSAPCMPSACSATGRTSRPKRCTTTRTAGARGLLHTMSTTCTLGIALAGCLCEMAWNQGEDLYGYANNRLLAGAEYVARNNLTDPATMPFVPYTGVHGTGTGAAGTGARRPCFERIYHHYVSRKGLSAPWTKAILDQMRPERIDGGDDPGMGTLLYTRSAVPPAPPTGLTAFLSAGKVLLSWWGSADATHYLVQR